MKAMHARGRGITALGLGGARPLAFVAAGRFDGYWERNLSPWDLAGGLLLVREAGGFVTTVTGKDDVFVRRQRRQ